MVSLGDHCLTYWSLSQQIIALSCGEAECYALVKCASVCLGVQALMKDLGVETSIRVHTDATTGEAMTARKGIGKVRHLDSSMLWIQDHVREGRLHVQTIHNYFNSADLFTKNITKAEIMKNMYLMGHAHEDGRSPATQDLNLLDAFNLVPRLFEILGINSYDAFG